MEKGINSFITQREATQILFREASKQIGSRATIFAVFPGSRSLPSQNVAPLLSFNRQVKHGALGHKSEKGLLRLSQKGGKGGRDLRAGPLRAHLPSFS